MDNRAALIKACNLALAGDWDASHNIAQDYADSIANWLHAVLHKIEGDMWNSQYWYARTSGLKMGGKQYEDFADTKAELHAILELLIF